MRAIKKAGLLCTLILFSGLLHAQYDDENEYDTIVAADTEPVPAEELSTDAVTDDYQTNEENTNYFKSKWDYTENDSLQLRRLPDSAVAALHADDDFWYANHSFVKKKKEAYKRSSGVDFYDFLLWFLIIGGFILFLGIYLVNNNVRLFRRSKSVAGWDPDPELDDIFAINYDKEIEKAVNAGNYRLGVRLMFLRTLRGLSDKNIIQYKQDRTNFDYLMQLSNTTWYRPFSWLARNYEYVWYGKFNIDEKQFGIIKTEFDNLRRQL